MLAIGAFGCTKTAAVGNGPSTTGGGSNKGIHPMGTKITTPITVGGIVSATVFGYYANVRSSQPAADHPPAGKSYGAIEAQECAGNGVNSAADETDFTILLSNGTNAGNPDSLSGHPTVAPLSKESELGSGNQSLALGQCDRGWIVFDIPNGVTPTYVQFTGTTAEQSEPNTVAKWTIPR